MSRKYHDLDFSTTPRMRLSLNSDTSSQHGGPGRSSLCIDSAKAPSFSDGVKKVGRFFLRLIYLILIVGIIGGVIGVIMFGITLNRLSPETLDHVERIKADTEKFQKEIGVVKKKPLSPTTSP